MVNCQMILCTKTILRNQLNFATFQPSREFRLTILRRDRLRFSKRAANPVRARRNRKIARMKARVIVTLKNGVLDPQGKAIEGALHSLGVAGVASVRQGKVFDIEVTGDDRDAAKAQLQAACEKLLANTVIENYHIDI